MTEEELYKEYVKIDGNLSNNSYEYWLYKSGYNKAEEILYTREDVLSAINLAKNFNKTGFEIMFQLNKNKHGKEVKETI